MQCMYIDDKQAASVLKQVEIALNMLWMIGEKLKGKQEVAN